MSNYTKTTNFATKDSLASGNPNKIVKGTEINSEFDNIATAVATKANTASPSLTGTVTAAALNVTGNLDVDGTLEFDSISGTGSVAVTDIADEDNMSSDSATKLATQQSIKAYVDSQVTAQDLDLTDGSTSISIDLDSEALSVLGGTGVTSTASGNGVTLAIDSTVTTLTGSQTLTNKTLTSPDVNTPDIDGGTIDGTVIGGATAAAGSFTTVGATGNITVGGTVDGRDVATDGTKLDGIEASATADQSNAEIRTAVEAATDSNVFTDADHTKLNAIEASADVTDTANVTAAGALMDSELTAIASVKALNQGVATGDSPTFVDVTATSLDISGNIDVDGTTNLDVVDIDGAVDMASTLQVDGAATFTTEITANGGIALGDNDKATFGAGDDLQIYSDGTNAIIKEDTGGSLYIGGADVHLMNPAFTEYYISAAANGAVTLRHDNASKLATTATGIDVTGTATMDGLTLADGGDRTITGPTNNDLIINSRGNTPGEGTRIQSSGSDRLVVDDTTGDISFYEDTGTTPKLFWDASAESLGIGTSSPSQDLEILNGVTGAGIRLAATGTAYWDIERSASTGHLTFTDDGAGTVLTVGQDGNVGIGTSSVIGNLNLHGGTGDTASQDVVQTFTRISSTGNRLAAKIRLDHSTTAHADLKFQVKTTASSAENDNYYTDALTIQGLTGKVGIGTISPIAQITSTEGFTATGLATPSNTNTDSIQVGHNSTDGVIRTWNTSGLSIEAYNPIKFSVANTERMRIDSSGNVGIGTSNPSSFNQVGTAPLMVIGTGSNSPSLTLYGGTSSSCSLAFADGTTTSDQYRGLIQYTHATDSMVFLSAAAERMRIDSSGNLLVGTTDANPYNNSAGSAADNGFAFGSGALQLARYNDAPLLLNRTGTNDGDIQTFWKSGFKVGSIGTVASRLFIGNDDVFLTFQGASDRIYPASSSGGGRDNAIDLGEAGTRFKDIYATNGTIQTSDRNEKQDIAELNTAETAVAVACKGLLRKFRWKDSVAEKGDDARTHFGIIAQDLQAAFEAEGLDAGDYAMFISTTWTDEETNEEKTRMGVRYSELLAFIISAI